MEPFLNAKDVGRYLDQSILMYKGRPVMCSAMGLVDAILVQDLNGESERVEVLLSDPDLTNGPFNLGFMNGPRLVFLQRMAFQASLYGLRRTHITVLNRDGVAGSPLLAADLFRKGFVNCLLGKYPSFSQAFSQAYKRPGECVAFHKHYALTNALFEPYLEGHPGALCLLSGLHDFKVIATVTSDGRVRSLPRNNDNRSVQMVLGRMLRRLAFSPPDTGQEAIQHDSP